MSGRGSHKDSSAQVSTSLSGVLGKFLNEYQGTAKRLKIVDAYLVYIFFTGIINRVFFLCLAVN